MPTTCAPSSPAQSLADVAKKHINRYAADHPRIEALGAPSIDDDRLRNVIVLRERYAIRDLWKNGSWTYYPRAIEQHLTRPETLVRSMPLAVDYPRDVTERLIIRGGANAQVEDDDSVVASPGASLRAARRARHAISSSRPRLRAMKDAVPVAEVRRSSGGAERDARRAGRHARTGEEVDRAACCRARRRHRHHRHRGRARHPTNARSRIYGNRP